MRLNRSATAGGLVALLTLGVFARVVGHEFIVYDDPEYVVDNQRVLDGITRDGLVWALTTFTNANWHPLTWVSHMLDVEVFGAWAGGHHLTNLLLHTLSSLLLFVVLRGMTGKLIRSALVAALFAVHPLHVQSVAWVAERKDVLSGLFWMLTLGAYLRYARSPGRGRFAVTCALFVLGLTAKPMVVTLPAALLLLDFWPLGRLATATWRRDLSRLAAEKAPLFLLSVGSAAVTLAAQQSGRAVAGLEHFPVWVRLANSLISYMRYIVKTMLPLGLSAYYPHPGKNISPALGALCFLALGLLTAIVLRSAARRGYLLTGWAWYIVTLLPVIGLVQVGSQAGADRYTYLPLIGIFILIVWSVSDAAAAIGRSLAASVAAAVLLSLLAGLAWRENGFWKDSLTLIDHSAAATPPSNILLIMKGAALLRLDRLDEAIPLLREAVAQAPGEADLHYNLGSALARHGESAEAAQQYRESLALFPDDAGAHIALATLLAGMEQSDEALDHLLTALKIDPDNAVTHRELSLHLEKRGATADALAHARRAAELRPGNPRLQFRLGLLLARADRLDEALGAFNRVIALEPRHADALYNIGLIHDLQGDPRLAAEFYRRSLALDPASAPTHISLGAALMGVGERAAAITHFREALRLEPDSLEARINLMRAQDESERDSPPPRR